MRLYLVIDETSFYQPNFVARFLENTKDTVVGVALVTKVSPRSDIGLYLQRHWYYLRPWEILRLIVERMWMMFGERFLPKRRGGHFCSVRSVLEFFGVDFQEVEYTLNKPGYLDHIRKASPDIIVSSNSIIFGKEVLAIPRICCLNRHSALLPAYGGLFPVVQAYRCGEKIVGASVHLMENSIDTGAVLAQQAVEIKEGDTIADLYIKCFAVSSDVLLAALERVRAGDVTPCKTTRAASYFSFPTAEHWRELRARGGRFI